MISFMSFSELTWIEIEDKRKQLHLMTCPVNDLLTRKNMLLIKLQLDTVSEMSISNSIHKGSSRPKDETTGDIIRQENKIDPSDLEMC